MDVGSNLVENLYQIVIVSIYRKNNDLNGFQYKEAILIKRCYQQKIVP